MTTNASTSTGHHLTDEIVYGPVRSRRYGRTIGINLLPSVVKYCSFNCVYCQLGMKNGYLKGGSPDFPSFQKVKTELDKHLPPAISKNTQHIVLSGNGEPTLHPDFCKIITAIIEIRDRIRPDTHIVCLTNGSTVFNPKILSSLSRLNEVGLKLDAGWEEINKPVHPFELEQFVPALKKLSNLVIQSCFLAGAAQNTSPDKLRQWMDQLMQLCPRRIDLYTVSRQTALPGILPVDDSFLHEIAGLLHKKGLKRVRVCD